MMNELSKKAKSLGASEFGLSTNKNKRFYVVYNNKRINFGSNTNNTFIDHHDEDKKRAWKARHKVIRLKSGKLAYKDKTQSSFWAYKILW